MGYRTRVDEHAALLLAEDGSVTTERLDPNTDLSYTLGERHCAGAVDGDHIFTATMTLRRTARNTPTSGRVPAVPVTASIPSSTCVEEHAVHRRRSRRMSSVGSPDPGGRKHALREQGATRPPTSGPSPTAVSPDRSRPTSPLSWATGSEFPRRYRDSTSPSTRLVGVALCSRTTVATYDFEYDLPISDRPMAETLATGTVRGTKGRVAVLENNGSVYAVDLRQLVGYALPTAGLDQGSIIDLGAFGPRFRLRRFHT